METKLQQLSDSCATKRIDNCEILQGKISVLSTTVRDLEQKLHSRTDGMIEDPSERLLDVMEERLGGFSAHMQNSLQRLLVSCAEVRDHDGIVLNGRVNDLSKQLREMELKLQIRMSKEISGCNDTSARLEKEFMEVATHLDATLTGKATEINTKMEACVSAMGTKLSRELAKHEEIVICRHEQISQEGVDLKASVAEMEHRNKSNLQHLSAVTMRLEANVTEQAGVREKINDNHHQQLITLCSAIETRLRNDVASLRCTFLETKGLLDQKYSNVGSNVDLLNATTVKLIDKIDCFIDHNLVANTGATTLMKATSHSDSSHKMIINACDHDAFQIDPKADDTVIPGVGPDGVDPEIDPAIDPEIGPEDYSEIGQAYCSQSKIVVDPDVGYEMVESRLDLADDLNSGPDDLGPGIVGSDETESESGSNIKPDKIGQLENGPDDIGPEIIDCDEPRSENATTHSKVDTNGKCLEAIHTGLEAINRGLEVINQKMAAEAITRNTSGPDESGPKDISRGQEQERANQLEREPKRESEPERDPEPETAPVPKPKPGEIGLETINHADVTSSDYMN